MPQLHTTSHTNQLHPTSTTTHTPPTPLTFPYRAVHRTCRFLRFKYTTRSLVSKTALLGLFCRKSTTCSVLYLPALTRRTTSVHLAHRVSFDPRCAPTIPTRGLRARESSDTDSGAPGRPRTPSRCTEAATPATALLVNSRTPETGLNAMPRTPVASPRAKPTVPAFSAPTSGALTSPATPSTKPAVGWLNMKW